MIIFEQEDIKQLIPHRYENFLIDRYFQSETDSEIKDERLELTISEGDLLNRDVFLGKTTSAGSYVLTPFLMEILAICAIISTRQSNSEQQFFFASITHFKRFITNSSGESLKGFCNQLSKKQNFYKYRGSIFNESNGLIAQGDMTAFYANKEINTNIDDAKKTALPKQNTSLKVDRSVFPKSDSLILIDEIIDFNKDPLSITYRYHYSKKHLLVKGHFPQNPVMMGVMQWMGIEDGAVALYKLLKLQGKQLLSGDALIFNDQGIITAEIKHFTISIQMDNTYIQANIETTKKLLFRSIVNAGDTIFVQLSNLVFSPT